MLEKKRKEVVGVKRPAEVVCPAVEGFYTASIMPYSAMQNHSNTGLCLELGNERAHGVLAAAVVNNYSVTDGKGV